MTLASPTVPTLTAEDHAHFLEHGYVVVKRAIPLETLAAALKALDAGSYTGTVGAANYQAVRAEAVEACITDTVHAAIGELFGAEYPFERARHGSDMPRPQETGREWPEPVAHVDDDYPTFMPAGWAVGTFVFLTPVRSHGGAFVVFPGSVRRYQDRLAATPGAIKGDDADARCAGPPQEFLAEPGDVVLFHHLMGHSGSPNVSDPTTRHALLSRWHPDRRIVPGDKPLEAMSTIEKANSARFLRERVGATLAVPACRTDAEALALLREGLSVPGGLAAHALLHFDGQTHLFCVSHTELSVVHHARTSDLLQWEFNRDTLPLPGPAHSLSLFQRGPEVFLMAGVGDETLIFSSSDLKEWAEAGTFTHARCGVGHFSTPFGSRIARGRILFFIPPSDPRSVRCRWGRTWGETAETTDEARAAEALPGGEIVGLCLAPVFGESQFALVADVKEASGQTQPCSALSGDGASYPDPLQPLTYTAPTPPCGLRVYRRARNFWMLTYLREEAGSDRMFWGVIDWEQSPPTLREITTGEGWRDAFHVTGLA